MKSMTGKNKCRARGLVGQDGKRYNCVLDLPAEKCLSTASFLNRGLITTSTRYDAFENRKCAVEIIQTELARLGLDNFRLHHSNVIDPESEPTGPYDLVNLDLCSGAGPDLLTFLSRKDLFLDGADLYVTLSNVYRNPENNKFKVRLERTFSRAKNIFSTLDREYGDYDLVADHKVNEFDRILVAAIATAMNGYIFRFGTPFSYKDKEAGKKAANRMVVFSFLGIRKSSKRLLPSFWDIYDRSLIVTTNGSKGRSRDNYKSHTSVPRGVVPGVNHSVFWRQCWGFSD